jgi:hypothetical protein
MPKHVVQIVTTVLRTFKQLLQYGSDTSVFTSDIYTYSQYRLLPLRYSIIQ